MGKKIEHKVVGDAVLKLCGHCKKWLLLDGFGKDESRWDKLSNLCKKCNCLKSKKYNQKYPDKLTVRNKKFRDNNPEYSKQYYCENIDSEKKRFKNYREKYPDRRKETVKNWQSSNYDKRNNNEARRRARKFKQITKNVNLEKIQQLYEICSETNKILGDMFFHVDHIQPLSKGGLHHEDNLQILEAHLNLEKQTKFPLTEEEKTQYKGFKIN